MQRQQWIALGNVTFLRLEGKGIKNWKIEICFFWYSWLSLGKISTWKIMKSKFSGLKLYQASVNKNQLPQKFKNYEKRKKEYE